MPKTEKLSEPELAGTEKAFLVGIKGRPPGILMHNGLSMAVTKTKPGGKTCMHNIPLDSPCNVCLESMTYRTNGGNLAIPSVALHGALIGSSRQYRVGRRPAAPLIAGTVRIEPDMIDLGVKTYDVSALAVVQHFVRVLRHRPWVKEWEAECHLVYDSQFFTDPSLLKEILTGAGRRVGILDYRPGHSGRYGTFDIVKWKEI